ncbi:MAG: PIN domain-containing protein [Firmicutes bacterium]|nr:PIN domain-containing protein [Bacillota bacterium]
MKFVFVDTSGIVAAMNTKDEHHQAATKVFAALVQERCALVITNYVRAETHALLVGRAGRDVAFRFLEEKSWSVKWVGPEDEEQAMEIMRRYQDKTFSLIDATSFVVMKRLEIDTAIAFDRHFQQYGIKVLGPVDLEFH